MDWRHIQITCVRRQSHTLTLPVNGAQKLALMSSHLGDVYSSVRGNQLRVFVYQPSLTKHIGSGVLQLTKSHNHLSQINTNSNSNSSSNSSNNNNNNQIKSNLLKTRNSCIGRSPVQSIGHARSCRRRVAAYWIERTWRSQKCKYLRCL